MDTNLNYSNLAQSIKERALALGFEACGITQATAVDSETRQRVARWLAEGKQAEMGYLANHFEKRCDPRLLVEGCQSLIVVALNYLPKQRQACVHPQFSVYAYGVDYHLVMKQRLSQLLESIQKLAPQSSGRCFCDTAPILERYWAERAGIGFIGHNRQLILPHKGSHFFLGVITSDLPLSSDPPLQQSCLECLRCINACPTQALSLTEGIDANLCLSYHTIENRGEIPPDIASKLGNRVYGCDTCQTVCPHNREACPTQEPLFDPTPEFMQLDYEALAGLTAERFNILFRQSAIKRTKYTGLMRNLQLICKKA